MAGKKVSTRALLDIGQRVVSILVGSLAIYLLSVEILVYVFTCLPRINKEMHADVRTLQRQGELGLNSPRLKLESMYACRSRAIEHSDLTTPVGASLVGLHHITHLLQKPLSSCSENAVSHVTHSLPLSLFFKNLAWLEYNKALRCIVTGFMSNHYDNRSMSHSRSIPCERNRGTVLTEVIP